MLFSRDAAAFSRVRFASVIRCGLVTVLFAAGTLTPAMAGSPTTADFESAAPPHWKGNIGSWTVSEGHLVGTEVAADHHAAAGRWIIPLTDGTVSGKFRLGSAKMVHLGFDPARGQMPGHKGHLASCIISPKSILIRTERNKADEKSKAKVLAREKVGLSPEAWVEFELTFDGDSLSAKIGDTVVNVNDPSLHVGKTGLVLRVAGGEAWFDDLSIEKR